MALLHHLTVRVPVRWRLAAVSAAMTLSILLVFAVLVGQLTTSRLRQDFDTKMNLATADLQTQLRIASAPFGLNVSGPNLDDYAAAEGAVIRVVNSEGKVFAQTKNAPKLGLPNVRPQDRSGYRVVARSILAPLGDFGQPVAWVQYARRTSDLNATIDQLWLFLLLGVVGGTGLAMLAGWALARGAMRPISSLTAAAKEVARTRDPSKHIPQPQTKDEIADLARTLEQMLTALNQARSESEAALKAQREFLADASHELRTPLTSILANLELLQDQELGEEVGEATGGALRSAKRMRTLVADLLLLARADAGRPGTRSSVDLSAVVEGVVSELKPLVGSNRIEATGLEGNTVVYGNSEELHRLVLNLIDNAAQYSTDDSPIQVKLTRNAKEVSLSISDRGPGISPELEKRIFGRFVRGPDSGNESTGLGLAIVKAVVESHSGRVAVENNPDGGACFTVILPLR